MSEREDTRCYVCGGKCPADLNIKARIVTHEWTLCAKCWGGITRQGRALCPMCLGRSDHVPHTDEDGYERLICSDLLVGGDNDDK